MESHQLDKYQLSYDLLVLAAKIDGYFDPRENLVIKEYFKMKPVTKEQQDNWLVNINKLDPATYDAEIEPKARDFLSSSSHNDRLELNLFLMKLIDADNVVKASEHSIFKMIFELWDEDNNENNNY